MRNLTRPRTALEQAWLDRYDAKHPAPERMAKALERDLAAPADAARPEVRTGPPTPSITAPPLAPAPVTPEVTGEAPASSAPAPEPGGLPPLPSAEPDKPRPALAPITVDNNPMAKMGADMFRAGAEAWGRTLRRPFVGAVLVPYSEAYGIALAEWYREKFGDGPLDRNKVLVAGTVVAAGGVVEPFFMEKPPEEKHEPERPSPAAAPHEVVTQPETQSKETNPDDLKPASFGAAY